MYGYGTEGSCKAIKKISSENGGAEMGKGPFIKDVRTRWGRGVGPKENIVMEVAVI